MLHIPTRLEQAEFRRIVHFHTPAKGNTFEDVMKPEYWGHVTHQLEAKHRIEILSEDFSYFAELMVVAVYKNSAKVVLLRKADLKALTVEDRSADFFIKFRGPRKWSILRASDNEVVEENIVSEEDAKVTLDKYLKELAA